MANTYTQIHIQSVFAVENRISLLNEEWEDELYKYITGIVQGKGHKMLQINGAWDHIHVFFGMRPTQALSDLMQDIKADSSTWINDRKLTRGPFAWQSGYAAFSYSKSQVPTVIEYIKNQKEHHKRTSFREEYIELLKEFDVDYNEWYVFKEIL